MYKVQNVDMMSEIEFHVKHEITEATVTFDSEGQKSLREFRMGLRTRFQISQSPEIRKRP